MNIFDKIPLETRVGVVFDLLRKESDHIRETTQRSSEAMVQGDQEDLQDEDIGKILAQLNEAAINSFEQSSQRHWEEVVVATAQHFGQDAVDEALKKLRQEQK